MHATKCHHTTKDREKRGARHISRLVGPTRLASVFAAPYSLCFPSSFTNADDFDAKYASALKPWVTVLVNSGDGGLVASFTWSS